MKSSFRLSRLLVAASLQQTAQAPVSFHLRPTLAWALVAGVSSLVAVQQDAVAQEAVVQFSIPAQPLAGALRIFSQQSGHQMLFPEELVRDKHAQAVQGRMTPRQALDRLLDGAGIQVLTSVRGVYTLRGADQAGSEVTTLSPVRVSSTPNALPPAYSGGQVASGSRVGILGNRDVMDTPFSMTSYTSTLMENQQARTVMEVLRSEPSVRGLFPEGGLGEYFNVRGFYMQSHELAWNGQYGLVPHNRTPVELLERVEVLRGPGALLNGMSVGGAVGGVINLVPKRASDSPLTRLTTGWASDSNLSAHVDVGRRYGETGEFGIRVNALKSHGNGVVDDQKEDRQIASVALDYRGERVRASLDAYSIREKQDGGMPLMTTFASDDIPDAPDAKTNTLAGANAMSHAKAVIGSVEYDVTNQWTVFATAGIKRQHGEGYLNNALGMAAQPSGSYTGVAMNIDNYFHVRTAEAGVRGRFDTGPVRHNVVVSVNGLKQETGALAGRSMWASNLYAPTTAVLAASPGEAPKSSDITLSSIAIADTLSFAQDKYQLTLGLRQQRVRVRNFAATGAETSSYDERAVTPAVALVVKPWDAPVSLYANYIEGLSQGGTVSDATASNYGEVFPPYKSKQVELGVKWDAGRFMHTLSAFRITQPSLIKDTASNTYAADGQQRNRGLEWTTAGELVDGVRLLGGAAYLDAVTTKTASGTLDGKKVIGVPRWQANLGIEWDTPWVHGLTLSAQAVHTGKQYVTTTNTQELPGWTRFDLGVRYGLKVAGKNVVLRGGVTNVFDKRYWSGVWNGYASVGAPRSFRLSAQIDF